MTSIAKFIPNHPGALLFTCLSTLFNHFTMIMQNKPNFRKSQMTVNSVFTRAYENKSNWTLGENKPNSNPIQSQSNPISKQNKANQSQSNPISKPIQSQSNPKEQVKNPEFPPNCSFYFQFVAAQLAFFSVEYSYITHHAMRNSQPFLSSSSFLRYLFSRRVASRSKS